MDREARKFIRWWAIIALLIAVLNILSACTKPQTAPRPVVKQIVTTSLVENNIAFFYYTVTEVAKLEVSFCMAGYASEKTETLLLQRLLPVWIDSAGQAALWHQPATCPDSQNVVGVLHTHPPQDSAGVWNSCEFSDTDIIAAHWNKYPTTAIVCKALADSVPTLLVLFRREFDERWRNIKPDTSSGLPAAPWKATYHYRRPP